MILSLHPPKKSLSKSFLKQRPVRDEFDKFKNNLRELLNKIDIAEREENQKTHIRDFLVNTYYKGLYEINTKDNKDLVIHNGKSNKDNVGVIIETKRPGNKSNRNEMISGINPNSKAFQELVLYYLNERVDENNIDIKYCIATNINEWFIFDAAVFEKYFYRNKDFVKQYEAWKKGQKVMGDTNLFYNDIAKPFIDNITDEIPVTYFDLRDYEDALNSNNPDKEKKLISLFKLLSPNHLLRITAADDSNKLDEKFYKELLHIIGLEEVKEGSKNIIRRKEIGKRDDGSLIENTISKLSILDSADRVSDSSIYGDSISKDDKNFNIALELCITWINRILFLKLLEAQLLYYHSGNTDYKFLNKEMLKDFDEVFSLFHHVLAVPSGERDPDVKKKFELIPYLNSTLFEISKLEKDAINISQLNDSLTLDLISTTILKDIKKNTNSLSSLEYLLKFLDAYDFASESSEDIQESSKTLINASVLGKVFEKINGYKDGSIFTPGFITMYMCREAIRPAVVQKFRDKYEWNTDSFDDLKNFISDKRNSKDILEFNEVVNSIKICDPAVGSGHFLVSSLNEIIALKSELGILADDTGTRLTDYDISIEQDELIITDRHGDIFEYKVSDFNNGKGFKVRPDIQKFQSTLFHEKQKIIENCLFGVDINQNSVKICRLRLWIELLKNAYYKYHSESLSVESFSGSRSNEPPPGPLLKKKEGGHEYVPNKFKEGEVSCELETLPNIDINIKCGNSLISRFALDANLGKYGQNVKDIVEQYRENVKDYKNEKNRNKKKEIDRLINSLKSDIRTTISKNDPKLVKLNKLKSELDNMENQSELFDQSKKDLKDKEAKKKNLQKEITKLNTEVEDIRSNAIYRNAFEWRFEFPEVLNEDGEYEGFDVVIGNPPYIRQEEVKHLSEFFKIKFKSYSGKSDVYVFFYEKGISVLKPNGILNLITSGKFLEASYGKELLEFLIENFEIQQIINFNDLPVFEGVTAYPIILKGKNKINKDYDIEYFDLSDLPKNTLNEKLNSINPLIISRNNFVINDLKFLDKNVSNLIVKVNNNSISLAEFCGLPIVGVKTGFNKGYLTEIEKSKYVKPYIFGKDIKKYELVNSKNNIIFPYNDDFTIANLEEDKEINIQLNNNKDNLSKRAIIREGIESQTKFWFEYQQINKTINYADEFIVYPNVTFGNNFALSKNAIIDMTAFIIKSNSKYLLSILNSKLISFLMNIWSIRRRGGYLEYKVQYVEKIPIKEIPFDDQQPFIEIVNKIIESKKQNKDTTSLEAEIDRMVYELYGLTEDEVKVVEEGRKDKRSK